MKNMLYVVRVTVLLVLLAAAGYGYFQYTRFQNMAGLSGTFTDFSIAAI